MKHPRILQDLLMAVASLCGVPKPRPGWNLPQERTSNGAIPSVRYHIRKEHPLLLGILHSRHWQHQEELRIGVVEDPALPWRKHLRMRRIPCLLRCGDMDQP